MELFVKKDKRSDLEKERDEAIKLLSTCVPGTDEYMDQLGVVERLNAVLIEDDKRMHKISPDTVATCACSIAGVVLCAYRDYWHPIATKGLNFVLKGRGR